MVSLLYGPALTSIHHYWENDSFDYVDLCRQLDVSAFKDAVEVCRLLTKLKDAPSRRLLISWLLYPSAVIMEPKKVKSVTASISSPSICQEVMGPVAMILVFFMLSFRPFFALSSFTSFNSSSLSAIRLISSAYRRLLIFLPAVLIPAWDIVQSGLSHDVFCV